MMLIGVKDEEKERLNLLEENMRLRKQVEMDLLTGIYNKITLENLIKEKISKAEEEDKHIFFVIDIDNFKEINDGLGHLAGDAIIREIAQIIKSTFREEDVVGRVGGDEFLAYMQCSKQETRMKEKAKQICRKVEKSYLNTESHMMITVSIGMAVLTGRPTYKELFSNADKALYHAKHLGKNRYVLYGNVVERAKYKREVATTMRHPQMRTNIVADVVDVLYNQEFVEKGIQEAISLVGRKFQLDRVYIYEFSNDKSSFTNTFQWKTMDCDEKNEKAVPNIPQKEYPYFPPERQGLFEGDNIWYCSDINLASGESRDMMEELKAKAVIQVRILVGSEIVGYIGFDVCKNKRIWSGYDIENILLLSKIIGEYLRKRKAHFLLNSGRDVESMKRVSEKLCDFTIYLDIKSGSYRMLSSKNPSIKMEGWAEDYDGALESWVEDQVYHQDRREVMQTFSYDYLKSFFEEGNREFQCDFRIMKKGRIYWKTGIFMPIFQENILKGVIGYVDDITDSKALKYIQGKKDTLTSIYNLESFYNKVRKVLEENPYKRFAIVTFDVNRFKVINDMYGHETGNKILITIASVLMKFTKIGNCARFYSDVFGFITEYDEKEDILDKIAILEDTVQQELFRMGINLYYGIYTIKDFNLSIPSMCDRSLAAKNRVKGSGLKKYMFYDEKIMDEAIESSILERDMEKGLRNKEFILYMQPKFNIKNKKMIGAEVLIRWHHPQKGIISPGKFIPLFEQNGFIMKLDAFIWEEAFKQMKNWIREGKTPLPISLNISRYHIYNPQLMNIITGLLEKYELNSSYVSLEMTESLFVEELDHVYDLLNEFHEKGFRLEMDDFGSGYSSLNMLRKVPVDTVKIDRVFLDEVLATEKGKVVLQHAVAMAKELGLKVLAEGVESKEQLEYLEEIHCDSAQGFYLARPFPMEEMNYSIS